MTSRRFAIATAVAYFAIGLVAFARILTNQFLSDDWEFLLLVERAPSVWTCFAPLVGRFLRPLVVLLYYANFKLFGLNPFPYHLMLVLVHVLNAWLVCQLAIRIDAERRRWIGFWAGLLFLLFAGHAEAVSWVAGAADPLLVPFLIGSLLLFARGLEAERPLWPFAIAWVLFALGMLAKEVGAILPALAVAYAVMHASRTKAWRPVLTRTAWFIAVPVALTLGYLWLRAWLFGAALGAYSELGSRTFSPWLLSAFVFRSFLPPMVWVARLWLEHRHVLMIAVGAIAFALALLLARLAGRDWRAMLFSLAGVAIGLAPVLPLSIAILSTESERYVYVATVFSCIAMVQFAAVVLRPRAAMAALALLVVANALYLDRANRTFVEAGRLTNGILGSLIETLRAEPPQSRQFVLLSSVDNMRGAYIFRAGFYAALHLFAPDLDTRSIQAFTAQSASTAADRFPATQIDARTFALDIRPEGFFEVTPPTYIHAEFTKWSRSGYTVRFRDSVPPSVVLAVDAGRVKVVGRVTGLGLPIGFIDTPVDGVPCAGENILFAGWAVDDEEVVRVVLEREAAGSASRVEVGTAVWSSNTRPDVAAVFRGFPHLEKAGWDFLVPCSIVAQAPERRLRLHVVAIDAHGHRSDVGARTIIANRD